MALDAAGRHLYVYISWGKIEETSGAPLRCVAFRAIVDILPRGQLLWSRRDPTRCERD